MVTNRPKFGGTTAEAEAEDAGKTSYDLALHASYR
jgi:hypothetical protein